MTNGRTRKRERARRRAGLPRWTVTLHRTVGAWSGEPYWQAECGCGWRARVRRAERGNAVADGKRHSLETRHALETDVDA